MNKIRLNRLRRIERSPIIISAFIYKYLISCEGKDKLDNIYKKTVGKLKIQHNDFHFALIFLYSLGKINYSLSDDVLELVRQ